MGNTVVKKVSPSSSLDNFNIQNNVHDYNRQKNTPVKYVTCLDVTSENIDENSIKNNDVPLFIECPNCHTHVNYVCFHTWKHDSKSKKCLHCRCLKRHRDSE